MYVNGICTNGWYLSDQGSGVNRIYENFSHQSKMYINCDQFKKNFGACDIKELLVYGRPLTHDEVLKNYISSEKVLSEQEKKYKFNYENKTTPVIKMYGDTTNMTDLYQVPMRIKYESPDEDKSLADSKALLPTLKDFQQKHPNITSDIFLGDVHFRYH